MRKHLYSLMGISILICAMAGIALAQLDTTPPVSIVTPVNGTTISGSQVEIAVGFDSTGDLPVSKVQVFLDGKPVTDRVYDEPVPNGICTFKWDTVRTPNGAHKIDVQVFSKDTYIGMASCTVTVSNKTPDLVVPRVAINSPKEGQVVSGVTPVVISASDNSGEPFVGIYVDDSLKLASNHGPYVYQWDTTKTENGPHNISATAADPSDNSVKAKSVRVIVRNPVKMTPITALPAEEKPTTVAQNVPAPPASTATPREPTAAKSESARTAPQANTTEKFEVDQTASKTAPAPAKVDKPVPTVKETPKPAPVAKPVETPKPAAPATAPDSTLPKPEQTPALMAKLTNDEMVQPTAKTDSVLATPEAPKPVQEAVETPKPVKQIAEPAVPLADPESTVSKLDEAVLMAKLPSEETAQPTAMADSKLVTPAVPKPQAKPEVKTVAPVVKAAPKPVAKTVTPKPVPVQKPAPNSSASKPDATPVLMAKLPETDVVSPVAKTDSKLITPASPKPQVKPVVKETPKAVAKPAPVKVAQKPVVTPKPVAAPVKMAKAETVKVAKAEVCKPIKSTPCSSSNPQASCKEYVLQPGDIIGELAIKFGVSSKAIMELNGIEDPRTIIAGDTILIPAKAKMVAIRPVFEQANGTVEWNSTTKEVHAVSPQSKVEIKIGSAGAVVNNEKITMEKSAVVSSGRTLVPESFVTKTLGMDAPAK